MNSGLEALERTDSLGERVYAVLRENLRAGRIPRGEPLQEAVLAAQLGVSRTPVREALARLASEGLVITDGRNFVGPELTAADIEEIFALRFLLELEALRLVAAGAQDRGRLAPLRRSLDDMNAAHLAGDGNAFMEANYRFRAGWMELVPYRRLARVIELYADHVRYLRLATLNDPTVRAGVLKRLKRLLAALAAADAELAVRAMREHLECAKRILLSASAEKPRTADAGDQ